MKILLFITFIVIVLSSCDSSEVDRLNDKNDTSQINENLSELKINNDVVNNDNKDKVINVEGKELIAPNRLFDFYPEKILGLNLEKSSSGNTRSGLGRYTTSTGVYEKNGRLIKVRISDYFDKEFFPDYQLMFDMPKKDPGFILTKLDLKDGYIGFMRWEENYKFGYISIFVKNRYHLLIDIEGFPEIKNNYKEIINKFNFED